MDDLTDRTSCCDYRDHGVKECFCAEHPYSFQHPLGWTLDPSEDRQERMRDDYEEDKSLRRRKIIAMVLRGSTDSGVAYVHLHHRNAGFRAGIETFVDHVLPAFVEGLAVRELARSDRMDEQMRQRMYQAPSTVITEETARRLMEEEL